MIFSNDSEFFRIFAGNFQGFLSFSSTISTKTTIFGNLWKIGGDSLLLFSDLKFLYLLKKGGNGGNGGKVPLFSRVFLLRGLFL